MHIDIAPHINTNQRLSGVLVGDKVDMATPKALLMNKNNKSFIFRDFISESIYMEEAIIRPKKKVQVCTG